MKGWRTLIFAIIVAVIGALEAFEWTHLIPDNLQPWVIPALGILFAWLRKITTTPLGGGEQPVE